MQASFTAPLELSAQPGGWIYVVWPASAEFFGARGRIDAADFGDMESDPFVRDAMARDVRAGWRQPHGD